MLQCIPEGRFIAAISWLSLEFPTVNTDWPVRRDCGWASGTCTEADKALAHIHPAHAKLPQCDEERALRFFVADELLEAGVAPA